LVLVALPELSQINLGRKGLVPYSIPLHPLVVEVVVGLAGLLQEMAETVVQVVVVVEMQQTTRV
jgi:hypothetical protein